MSNVVKAGLRRRLGSLLYEGLVVFSVLLIGFWLPQAFLMGMGLYLVPRMLWIHVFILLMLYFLWFWLNGGQTLPMKTWKLRVTDMSGRRARPMQLLLRYLAAWPSILLGGLGILWALIDKDRQFLHDRIAGTCIVSTVISSPPLDPPEHADGSQQEEG